MSRITTANLLSIGFIADPTSIVRRQGGVMINWASVSTVDSGTGKKTVYAGTPVGFVTTGNVAPRVASTRVAVGLLETNAVEGEPSAAKTGYGLIIGGAILRNRLPVTLDQDIIDELNAAGTGFAFQTATNSL